MNGRKLMGIAWPSFLAACVLKAVVFAVVDPLELHWSGQEQAWSRQAVYAGAFFVFELFGAGRRVTNDRGDEVIAILLAVGFFYLIITVTLGQIAARVEKKVAVLR